MTDRAPSLIPLLLASAGYNLLMLAAPLYLLNLYDKVVLLQSLTNLAKLSTIAACAFGLLLWLDGLRLALLSSSEPLGLLARAPTVQARLALLDLPFLPLALLGLWLLHPALALTGLTLALLAALARKLPPREAHLLMRLSHLTGQSIMATVGAVLVVTAGVSSGVIFAAAVLGARLYAPIEALALLQKPAPSPKIGPLYAVSGLPAEFSSLGLPRLKQGESLALIGATASGKTRLLRELAGYGEARVTFPSPDAQQSLFSYLPHSSAELGTFLGTQAQTRAALSLFGLNAELLTRPPEHLSAGERQLKRLALALHRLPRLAFLDTPETALDGPALDYLCGALLHLKAQGCSFIIATHHPQIIALCEHRLTLDATAEAPNHEAAA